MTLLQDFFHLFFPRLCEACSSALYQGEELVCLRCRTRLPQTGYGAHPDNKVARLFWGRVQLERAVAVYFFNKGARIQQLMHGLKYRNRPDIGVLLGRWMFAELDAFQWFHGIDLLVPVPLHPRKLKKRGYNQSAILARGIASESGIPLDENLLIRSVNSRSQTRGSRVARWNNVKEAFSIREAGDLSGMHILLVDDVITTGATLEACAARLREAGCRVSVLAVACAFQ